MTIEEKVLKFLLQQEFNGENKTLLDQTRYKKIPHVQPDRFIDALQRLDAKKLVSVNWLAHKSINSPCNVTMLSDGQNYFENKKKERRVVIFTILDLAFQLITFLLALFAFLWQLPEKTESIISTTTNLPIESNAQEYTSENFKN